MFKPILNMSITASYVILAIIIIRILFSRLPKKYSYVLWSAAAFRLCVPISFNSKLSLFSLPAFNMSKAQYSNPHVLTYLPNENINDQNITTGIESLNSVVSNQIAVSNEAAQAASVNPVDLWLEIFAYIWFFGMVVILLYGIISYIVLKIKLAAATKIEGNIFESEKINSPFILGVIKPKIYVPCGMDKKYYSYIVEHEKYHIKRCDHIIKIFAFIVLAVHFFNPLCYAAYYFMSRDMEMSCDEKVLGKFGKIKNDYSYALLSFAQKKKLPSPSPLCFGESAVKSRIKNILNFKKPKLIISIAAVLLSAVVFVSCTANPIENKTINLSPVKTPGEYEYYLGKCLGSSALVSSLPGIDGGNQRIRMTDKKLVMIDYNSIETQYSEKVEENEMTRQEMIEFIKDGLGEFYTTDRTKTKFEDYIPNDKTIIQTIYYDAKDNAQYIYSFDGVPALIGGMSVFELIPDAKGLENAISKAILDENSGEKYYNVKYPSEAHYIYQKRFGSIKDESAAGYVTVYLNALFSGYNDDIGYLYQTGAGATDIAIEFKLDENLEYKLSKYWEPGMGSEYNKDLKKTYPADVFEYVNNGSVYDSNALAKSMQENAIAKVVEAEQIDINKSIDTIIKNIGNDKLEDHTEEANFLCNYGCYTVYYVLDKYSKNELDENSGRILITAFDEILGQEALDSPRNTAKEYLDSWAIYAQNTYDDYSEYSEDYDPEHKEFATNNPYMYIYLNVYK